MLAVNAGRCDDHQREPWKKRPDITKRITGRRLQAMREALFARSPLCMACEKAGRVTAATQRDHIVPLGEGGLDDDSNVQALCGLCHEEKSLQEALRGRRRGSFPAV